MNDPDNITYYKIPFNSKQLIENTNNDITCDLFESIAQHLMLLITTRKGENRFDENYGNDVWSIEFDNGITSSTWEQIFIYSLREQILKYEKRIFKPKIEAHLTIVEQDDGLKGYTEIKKKVKIGINAKLESTGENFNFLTEIFLSPMSID